MKFSRGRLSRDSSWSSDDSSKQDGLFSRISSRVSSECASLHNNESALHHSNSSMESIGGSNTKSLDPPVLVYHSCARSIVFRDSIRCASVQDSESALSTGSTGTEANFKSHRPKVSSSACIGESDSLENDSSVSQMEKSLSPRSVNAKNFQSAVVPLPPLELGLMEEFDALQSDDSQQISSNWTDAELEVVRRFEKQTAVVKTIKNTEWKQFLERFETTKTNAQGRSVHHRDVKTPDSHFNSFVTSTSLLPANAKKMRCYGSTSQYTVGVVFALPDTFASAEEEDKIAFETETWAWPAGYAAKTEFNLDGRGRLINGRQEALVPLSKMRQYNDDYLCKTEYMVACKICSGLSIIPYNEVFVRIGGKGRIISGNDAHTCKQCQHSYASGLGLPIALFVRIATYEALITLMRTRAQALHILGEENVKGIPLLLIIPEKGVRVFTDALQGAFWKVAAQRLNPFQNSRLSYKTQGQNPDKSFIQQKLDELIHLDESIQEILTPQELAHLAGGFGATDESVAAIMTKVMMKDKTLNKTHDDNEEDSHILQDVVNEGLVYAVRSGDYYTSRQLLILYSVVAARMGHPPDESLIHSRSSGTVTISQQLERQLVPSTDLSQGTLICNEMRLSAPPPPPLDTDRLRSATNADGLLAVLGAAQVLKSMKDDGAKLRVKEVIESLEEWVQHGQHSVAFRISSWQNQRAAQGDLKIATESNANFTAFAGKNAITNRTLFAQRLRDAAEATDFTHSRFLHALHEIISTMHSPCLRLELLQYVLGLDNRYSVAHIGRSVELASTCLIMASSEQEEVSR